MNTDSPSSPLAGHHMLWCVVAHTFQIVTSTMALKCLCFFREGVVSKLCVVGRCAFCLFWSVAFGFPNTKTTSHIQHDEKQHIAWSEWITDGNKQTEPEQVVPLVGCLITE